MFSSFTARIVIRSRRCPFFSLFVSLSLSLFFLARMLERKKEEEEKKIGTVLQKRFIKSIAMELHFMNPPPIERDSLCYNRSVLILRSLGIVGVFVLSTRFFFFYQEIFINARGGEGGNSLAQREFIKGPINLCLIHGHRNEAKPSA